MKLTTKQTILEDAEDFVLLHWQPLGSICENSRLLLEIVNIIQQFVC